MRLLDLTAAVVVLASSMVARADTYLFTLTGGGNTFTYSLPSSPAPDGLDSQCSNFTGGFCLFSVPVTENGVTSSLVTSFFNAPAGGGLSIQTSPAVAIVDQIGPVVFTGTTIAPTFVLGSYSLTDAGDASLKGDYNLVISSASVAAVPETSSLLLLSTGTLGVIGTLRRRLFS